MGGIEDDNLAPLTGLNWESPVSYGWFCQIWRRFFSYLYTESDKPQCPECYEYNAALKEHLKAKDMNAFNLTRHERGLLINI